MNKTAHILATLALVAFSMAAPFALAGDPDDPDHQAAHGGQFVLDTYHHGIELVIEGAVLTFYLTLHGTPLDVMGDKFKAVVQTEAGTNIIRLTADGSTLKATLEGPLPKGAKVVLTGKDSYGDTIQARFVTQ